MGLPGWIVGRGGVHRKAFSRNSVLSRRCESDLVYLSH